MKILGISGSLRNARYGRGSELLVNEVSDIEEEDELHSYLRRQTKIRVDEFINAGRADGKPFDVLYDNLLRAKGDKGLSNSEAALVAGLWGAHREGAEIAHVGLSRHFPMHGGTCHAEELKQAVLECDAILISGPVYFGDRGSLVQAFVEFVSSDPVITKHLDGRVYAGIAVGAKRNGGQETQLIYQMVDMANINMLSVGNSADTTSQYGGTVLAGDVGTAWKDEYGLNTAIGTGRRLARIAMARESAAGYTLTDSVRIGVWLVQDNEEGSGLAHITQAIADLNRQDIEFDLQDMTRDQVYRCIACDLCPTHHAPRDEYACIIKSKDDLFVRNHTRMMNVDAILLAAYSPVDRSSIRSVYQQFIERTRYIRRSNYMLSDTLVAPFVISELNANQNLHIRMLTSLIRHHTVLHHPLIGIEQGGDLLNGKYLLEQLNRFVSTSLEMTVARLLHDAMRIETEYNPIGYQISSERNRKDRDQGVMERIHSEKVARFITDREKRLTAAH